MNIETSDGAVVATAGVESWSDDSELTMNRALLKRVLDKIPLGVYMLDGQGRVVYWNEGAQEMTGFAAVDVLGRSCCDNLLIHMDENGAWLCGSGVCPVHRRPSTGAAQEVTAYFRHRDGHRVKTAARTYRLLGRDGKESATAIVFDRFRRQASVAELEQLQTLALIDPLTEVGNRRFGERSLRRMVAQMERYRWGFGVLFADLDRFKRVNDDYGHCVGDQVLRAVARIMAESVRSVDVVCRWGGEEFLVILSQVSGDQLRSRAEALREMIADNAGTGLAIGLRVTVSLGATLATPADGPAALVSRADALMYRSKAAGGNRVTMG